MQTLILTIGPHKIELSMAEEDDLIQMLHLMTEMIRHHGVEDGFKRIHLALDKTQSTI